MALIEAADAAEVALAAATLAAELPELTACRRAEDADAFSCSYFSSALSLGEVKS